MTIQLKRLIRNGLGGGGELFACHGTEGLVLAVCLPSVPAERGTRSQGREVENGMRIERVSNNQVNESIQSLETHLAIPRARILRTKPSALLEPPTTAKRIPAVVSAVVPSRVAAVCVVSVVALLLLRRVLGKVAVGVEVAAAAVLPVWFSRAVQTS